MEQSTFADSRPRQVHPSLAIDIQDVAAVTMVDDNIVADSAWVVFRTGLVLAISPGAAEVLIELLNERPCLTDE